MKTHIAYTFDRKPAPGIVPMFCVSEFIARDDGQLEHITDGKSRAVVPPEGFDAYMADWPDCAPIVGELRGRPEVKQTVFVGEAAEKKSANSMKAASKKRR